MGVGVASLEHLVACWVKWEDVGMPDTPSFGPTTALVPLTREPSPWTLWHSERLPGSGASATSSSLPETVRGQDGSPRSSLGFFVCKMEL